MESLIRKNIKNLLPYSSAREEYTGDNGIFLDANENPFGTFNRYPDPYQKVLKNKIAEIKNVETNQVYIGNGSDEIIDLTFRIFCEPKQDKALTFTPTYGMYKVSAQINDVEIISVPLNNQFQINKNTLKPYLEDKNLKLIFICSPNNPTGNLINEQDIIYILNNFKGIVIIDEAYIDFSKQASFIKNIAKFPNLIVSQTLSKAWGLAGIRIGIAFMNTALLSIYNKVKPPYNVSEPNQKQALQALNDLKTYTKNIDKILTEKNKLTQALQQLSFVKKIYPSDANFVLMQVNDANKLYHYLANQQIIVRNRTHEVNNCIRISVGTAPENQSLITALQNF